MMSNNSPSPSSVVSDRNSPETKLTPFSPFTSRESQKATANTGAKIVSPPLFVLQGISSKGVSTSAGTNLNIHHAQDPFTNTPVKPKLSPTADNFTPLKFYDGDSPTPGTFKRLGAIRTNYLTPKSASDTTAHGFQANQSLLSLSSEFVPSPVGPSSGANITKGSFSIEDDCTRYLMIGNVLSSSTREEIETAFSCQDFSLPTFIVTVDLRQHGVIYVSFNDIREARKAYHRLQESRPAWTVQYIEINQYLCKYSPGSKIDLTEYKGEVHVTVNYYGSRQRYDAGGITYMVKNLLRGEGDIMSCNVIFSSYPQISFFARFFDILAAKMAIARLNGSKFAACSMTVSHSPVELSAAVTPYSKKTGPFITGKEDSSLDHTMDRLSLTPVNQTMKKFCETETPPVPGLSPASSSTPTSQELSESSPFGRSFTNDFNQIFHSPQHSDYPHHTAVSLALPTLYQTSASGFADHEVKYTHLMHVPNGPVLSPLSRLGSRQNNDYLSGHHNVVDVERIRLGLDVRTTIMLRNIPNKIDQGMLKEIIDETSFGKYDFMYLRIDFANNCNVGYAFVNFEDPWQIIDFVNARAGHRWNRFNSDKVAEVSYATIQGKDCLVQKFRNSSVMLEHPSFRPKIFHTNGSLLAGQEDTFPSPDNPSKMRRSVENAEHVGLFAPRAGQHFRNQQRRRRSQYDRGTRLAEFEDAYEVDDLANNVIHGFGPRTMASSDYRGYFCSPIVRY